MRPRRFDVLFALLLVATLHAAEPALAISVLTQHNDNARTGANPIETVLTSANVNVNQFGKLWSYAVTGHVYAQPLVVQGLTIAGAAHDVVFVATMHNNVYAFDANQAGAPLWSTNLGPSVPLPDPSGLGTTGPCSSYQDIGGEVGILSTPVIDLVTRTLYVDAKTRESGTYIDRLHALDIATGAEKMGGPIPITASLTGSAGTHTLSSLRASQRAGLLLSGSRVYVGFASYCDATPYYGWLLAYNALDLTQAPFVYSPARDGAQSGIWMSGEGPSADGVGNVYITTGNGSFSGDSGGGNFANSVIKLSRTLQVHDWFTPYNQGSLNGADLDLGSAGPMLVPRALRLPEAALIVAGGKEGKIYLLNGANLGHFQAGSDSQIVQSFMSSGTHLHGSPVYWNGPTGALVYVGAEGDYIRGYKLTAGLFGTSPFTETLFTAPSGAMPGSILSISSNGTTPGTGILWASMTISQDANHGSVPGTLRAFDASNLGTQLWHSQQNAARDGLGNHAKYCPPTIANGKVYMATFSNQVVVYGLLP